MEDEIRQAIEIALSVGFMSGYLFAGILWICLWPLDRPKCTHGN